MHSNCTQNAHVLFAYDTECEHLLVLRSLDVRMYKCIQTNSTSNRRMPKSQALDGRPNERLGKGRR